MNQQQSKRISKFLSFVLRHDPGEIGITLDEAGWIGVDELLLAISKARESLTREELEFVVKTNPKNRFEMSDDGQRVRARQGHSVEVELGYTSTQPPELLCHGTPAQFVELIRESGLKKMGRHQLHLHEDKSLAIDVGSRRGKPVLLVVHALKMHERGFQFYVTGNDVWLTDHVPPEFIDFSHV